MQWTNKYLKIRWNDPQASGQCDYSGIIGMRYDLKPQKEYYGNGLRNTGFLVHKDFMDKPNPQNLKPIIYKDPIPVKNPRPINPSNQQLMEEN